MIRVGLFIVTLYLICSLLDPTITKEKKHFYGLATFGLFIIWLVLMLVAR